MRKVVWLLVCFGVLLTGCAAHKAAPPAAVHFTCDAHIRYQDLELKAQLTRADTGALSVAITYPATLEDLKMVWNGNEVKVEMYGVSFDLDPDSLPVSGLGRGLLDALDAIAISDDSPDITDEGATVKGQGENGEFTLVTDPETGHLLSLTIPDIPLKVTFSNFQLTT